MARTPTAGANRNNNNNNYRGAARNGRNNNHTNNVAAANSMAERPGARQRPLSDTAAEVLGSCKTKPPHIKSTTGLSHIKIGGTNVLMDGLVAFAQTQASTITITGNSVNDDEEESIALFQKRLRQERAKILSRLLSRLSSTSGVPTPPSKGSLVVIGLSQDQITNSNSSSAAGMALSRVLYSLATYYTVMVIVQVKDTGTNHGKQDYTSMQKLQDVVVEQLRRNIQDGTSNSSNKLTESILPSHRIMLAKSATGRIALTRQLSTVELVVDFDPEVQSQLGRFGYKVSVVPDWEAMFGDL